MIQQDARRNQAFASTTTRLTSSHGRRSLLRSVRTVTFFTMMIARPSWHTTTTTTTSSSGCRYEILGNHDLRARRAAQQSRK
eukprot:1420602-Rhodomonas_salina.1